MSSQIVNAEETLADFIREIWSARRFVLVGALVGAVLAFVTIALAAPHMRASMILAPANPMNLAATPSGVQSYGRGQVQTPPSDTAENFTRFEARYKGASVAGLLLRDPEITDGLSKDKAFKFSKAEQAWSPEKLAEYIAKRVEIDPVGETSLRTFSYLHPRKEFAVMFLRRLHRITDGLIRHDMRKDVNERIVYLNAAIGETMNPDHRRTLTNLLMEQERLKMLVSIDQPYAASVVVPAAASVKARWPDAVLFYGSFMFVGALFGFVMYSALTYKELDFLAELDVVSVRQHDWFFPESGNSNEKPPETSDERPLTGKKRAKIKKKRSDKGEDIHSEAAE